MIIRTLNEIIGTERDVEWGNGQSRRFITDKDNMGFTMADVTIKGGSESTRQYPDNLESCYCLEGKGEIEDGNGKKHPVSPGTMYAFDKNDKHTLRCFQEMRVVCVFSPALITK